VKKAATSVRNTTPISKYVFLTNGKGTQSPLCRDANQISSKIGGQLILRSLIGLEIDPDSIPVQNEGISRFQTIVEANYVRPLDGTQVEIVDPM